jgi:hypothetical protein
MAMPDPIGRRHFTQPDPSWADDVAYRQVSPTQILVCPVCGDDYNHLSPPEPLLGWESSHNGERARYGWVGRGDGCALPIEGECGHSWVICLAFHKGQSFMFAVTAQEGTPNRFSEETPYPGLPDWIQRLHLADREDDRGAADPREDF